MKPSRKLGLDRALVDRKDDLVTDAPTPSGDLEERGDAAARRLYARAGFAARSEYMLMSRRL